MARAHQLGWALLLSVPMLFSIAVAPALYAQGNSPLVPNRADELAIQQSQLAEQHARLEKLLLRMAEFDIASNPRRAELLKKTFALSKEKDIQLQLDSLSRLLNQEKFKRAIKGQKLVRADLSTLLELLLSENRADRLKDEQARIKSYIKEIERLERIQRGVQGRNEGGVEAKQLAKEQQRVAKRTEELNDRIKENEGDGSEGADDSERQSDANESADSNGEPADPSGASEDKPDEAQDDSKDDGKSGDDASESGEPTDTNSNSGQGGTPDSPAKGQSQESKQELFPGQKQVEEAEQRMRDAQEKLDESKREDALEDQKEAARKLAEAKAELEEILRQMREEEIERTLAQLEGRVRKMLEMELQIHENTVTLARRKADDADRVLDIEAGKLSFQQRRVVVEADHCLAMLREEGSSVAFPASMESIREDMEEVVDRLAQVKIGTMTQGLEEDIMEALEEMIDALQQAQEDQEQRQQNQQMQQQTDPGEQPLVSQIAELKMLKALQLRINRRTDRYSKMLENVDDVIGQATDEELVDALQSLGKRELDLHQITRDISLGKNN